MRVTLPKDPVPISGDSLLLESALRNLIDNAIKYSSPDDSIEVSVTCSGSEALILVADTGRGLSGGSTPDLTGRFQRGANVDDIVGSGLGLTIVAEVALAHSGHFELIDQTGGGTCARLSLPLQ